MGRNSGFEIGDCRIGTGEPAFIVAEMSANHHQDFDRARRIIDAAAAAGADAIKVQTYTPDTITIDCDEEHFWIGQGTLWEGQTLYELYESAAMPWGWHDALQQHAQRRGLVFFSTPFDMTAVDFLADLNVPAYKISSFELVDLPLLKYIAEQKKPVILSTGMASLAEVDRAVRTIREAGNEQLILLKCTSAYPAPIEEANLRTIRHLAQSFGVPAGLSDHTLGSTAPVAAVVLGAAVIEKHLTLSRDKDGPDSAFSMEPRGFKAMVDAIRRAEQSMGDICYGLTEGQKKNRRLRRSLFIVDDVEAGEPLTPRNTRSIRPGHGLHPRYFSEVVGRRAARNLRRGTPLSWELVR